MSTFAQYISVVMLHLSKQKKNEALSGSFGGLSKKLATTLNSNITEQDIQQALAILLEFAAASHFDSPLTGGYWKIDYDNFRYYFIDDDAGWQGNAAEYAELKSAVTAKYPILVTYAETGDDFAKDVIEHIESTAESEWSHLRFDTPQTSDGMSMEVPASDRIVSLNHNQAAEVERPISEIIDALEADNGDPESPGLRERLLGQIRAGRELIRAGEFRAYLLHATLIRALGELISRYKNPTIVSLANALLGAIVSQLLQAS